MNLFCPLPLVTPHDIIPLNHAFSFRPLKVTLMRISLSAGLGRNATLDDLIAQIVKAEQDGFAGIWLSNIFGFDASFREPS